MLQFYPTSYGRDVGFKVPEYLGFLPMMMSEYDPRPASEQIDQNYAHGGGWNPFKGFTYDPSSNKLVYPASGGEPAEVYKPLAYAELHDERLYFYEGEWLAVVQPDNSFAVNRMD